MTRADTPAPVRSLADALRGFDAAALERLWHLRPDLAAPPPASLSELAERASSPASARWMLDRLNAWHRRVAVALAAMPDGESLRRVAALLQVPRGDVDAATELLCASALAWGTTRTLHLTSGARQALGTFPAGLAPASTSPLDDGEIDAALAAGGDEVRALLQRLVWEHPVGQVRDADRRGDGDSPADRALALGLLRPREAHTAILPREVSLRLRGGRLFEHPVPVTLPGWAPTDAEAPTLRRVDAAALGTAFELVRRLEHLVDELGARTVRPLASGAMSRRDAVALASLGGDADLGAFTLRLAQCARLIAPTARAWLPTTEYDRWVEGDLWQRWQQVRRAWPWAQTWPDTPQLSASPWPGGMSSGPGSSGSDTASQWSAQGSSSASSTWSSSTWSAGLRATVLATVRTAPAGTPIDVEHLLARIEFDHPTWHSETLPDLCARCLTEMSHLGLLALGHRTSLLDATSDPGLPPLVDHFVVQGDLTAISPGALTRDVGRLLNLVADRESVGVHRFTADSARRALDAGHTADQVRDWVAEHSDTGVPQPLAYLIDDVARRHGALQVSAVSSVVTLDDAVLTEALLADARAQGLGLRRLAPGVLGALAEPDEVVDLLRSLGHAPIARDAQGATAHTPADPRAPAPTLPPEGRPDPAALHRLALDLLARDDPAAHARGADAIIDLLRDHEGDRAWLEVDHVGDDGTPRTITARVLSLTNGWVRLQPRATARGAAPVGVQLSRVVTVRVLRRLGAAGTAW